MENTIPKIHSTNRPCVLVIAFILLRTARRYFRVSLNNREGSFCSGSLSLMNTFTERITRSNPFFVFFARVNPPSFPVSSFEQCCVSSAKAMDSLLLLFLGGRGVLMDTSPSESCHFSRYEAVFFYLVFFLMHSFNAIRYIYRRIIKGKEISVGNTRHDG